MRFNQPKVNRPNLYPGWAAPAAKDPVLTPCDGGCGDPYPIHGIGPPALSEPKKFCHECWLLQPTAQQFMAERLKDIVGDDE